MPTTAAALRELGVRFGAGADDLGGAHRPAPARRAGLSVAVSANEDTGVTIALPRGPRSFAAWPLAVEKPSKKPKALGIVTLSIERARIWLIRAQVEEAQGLGRVLRASPRTRPAARPSRRLPSSSTGSRPSFTGARWTSDDSRPTARPRGPRPGRADGRDLAQVRGGGALGGRRPAARREIRHQGRARAFDDGAVGGMADVDYKDRTDAQKSRGPGPTTANRVALVRVGWDLDSSEPAAKKPRVVSLRPCTTCFVDRAAAAGT